MKKKNSPYIIAEIGSNHNQDLAEALNLIDIAKKAGANAVKFQIFRAEDLYKKKSLQNKVKKYEFNTSWYKKLNAYCKAKKIDIFASTFGKESTNFLIKYNPPYIKWASSELTKLSNLYQAASFKIPMILSTGMADLAEVCEAVEVCKAAGNDKIILMHSQSLYPTKNQDMNLNSLKVLKNIFHLSLGISDHSKNDISSILAVAMGATYFEKHITMDKNQLGPDHHYALEPSEFENYVKNIYLAFKSMGKIDLQVHEEIKSNARKKSLHFRKNLKKGTILKLKHLIIKNNALGISPRFSSAIIGNKITKSVLKNKPVKWKSLEK